MQLAHVMHTDLATCPGPPAPGVMRAVGSGYSDKRRKEGFTDCEMVLQELRSIPLQLNKGLIFSP